MQRLWNAFQRDGSCFNFSLIYCEGWRWLALPLRYLSLDLLLVVYAVFPNFFISQSLHWRCVSAFSIAPVNADLANLPDSWFAFCFAYSVENGSQRNRFIDFESSIHGRPPRLGSGRCTFGISCEDCYAREISRFVCNKVRFFLSWTTLGIV